jgi:hypothetical protein
MKHVAQLPWRIIFSFLLSVTLFAQPEYPAHERHHQRPGRFWNQLSDVQKSELQTLISTLRDQDADHDFIRSAVHEKLTEWGIQPHRGLQRLAEKLTEKQKEELETLMTTLRSQNTAPREIHMAIREKLDEWGVPFRPSRLRRREDRSPQRTRERSESRVHPNPFNPDTHITYDINEQADVEISIVNTQGQTMRTFIMGNQAPGTYEITWDGRTDSGELAPSGSYLYTIKAGKQIISGHMLLMK